VGCAGDLTRGRRREGEQEGGGLSPLHARWNRYLPPLPAQPTAPIAPQRPSPSAAHLLVRADGRPTDRPADRWGLRLEEVEEIKAEHRATPCCPVSANIRSKLCLLCIAHLRHCYPFRQVPQPTCFRSCLLATSREDIQYIQYIFTPCA